jgi:hypothetical protein
MIEWLDWHARSMAHEVQYLLMRRQVRPDDVAFGAVSALRDSGLDVELVGTSRGDDWLAGDLEVAGQSTGILLEVHGADPSVAAAREWTSSMPNAPDLSDVTGLCWMTLSGEGSSRGAGSPPSPLAAEVGSCRV